MPARTHLPQVLVRRGDDAGVDVPLLAVARSAELPSCRTCSSFGLQRDRQVTDLVEDDGPAVGELEQPIPRRPRR